MSQTSIQEIVEKFFESFGFTADVAVDEELHTIEVESADKALLIGKKGETLRAIGYIINLLIKKSLQTEDYYSLDIGGYKKERIQKLETIAQQYYVEVIDTGKPRRLPSMNAYERRQIHMTLADNLEVTTRSEGEEPHRTIVIEKRISS